MEGGAWLPATHAALQNLVSCDGDCERSSGCPGLDRAALEPHPRGLLACHDHWPVPEIERVCERGMDGSGRWDTASAMAAGAKAAGARAAGAMAAECASTLRRLQCLSPSTGVQEALPRYAKGRRPKILLRNGRGSRTPSNVVVVVCVVQPAPMKASVPATARSE